MKGIVLQEALNFGGGTVHVVLCDGLNEGDRSESMALTLATCQRVTHYLAHVHSTKKP
jgi:hypothetical protein